MRSSETLDFINNCVDRAKHFTDKPSAITRYVASHLYDSIMAGNAINCDALLDYTDPDNPVCQLGRAIFQLLLNSDYYGVEIATITEKDQRLKRVIISSARLAEMSQHRFAIRQTHLHRRASPVSLDQLFDPKPSF